MWYCDGCGLPLKQQHKRGCPTCGSHEATRFPPLVGFVSLDVYPTVSEESDLERRLEWFERKRRRNKWST